MADPIIICDPAVLSGGKLRSKTRKSGAVSFSIEITAEPLAVEFTPKDIGQAVAVTLGNAYREKVENINDEASPATVARRARAAKEFAEGKTWAARRYSGGRIGAMPPNLSTRLFRDSGRFTKSIVVRASSAAWHINVAANRLDPRSAGGDAGVQRIWTRLVQLVPAFANVQLLMSEPKVRKAVEDGVASAFAKLEATRDQLTVARARARMAAIKAWIQVGYKIQDVASMGA